MSIAGRVLSRFFGASILLSLLACGGGDDEEPLPSGSNTQGVWRGTATVSGDLALTSPVLAMVSSGGGASLILNLNVSGHGDISDTGFSRLIVFSSNNFNLINSVFFLGSFDATSVTADPGSRLTFSGSNGDNLFLDVDLTFDPIYQRGASLATISGSWSGVVSGTAVNWSIDSSGNLTGSDSSGCIYSGRVFIESASGNVYTLRVTVSGCFNFNLEFVGRGTIADTATANDTLTYVISNCTLLIGCRHQVADLIRQ